MIAVGICWVKDCNTQLADLFDLMTLMLKPQVHLMHELHGTSWPMLITFHFILTLMLLTHTKGFGEMCEKFQTLTRASLHWRGQKQIHTLTLIPRITPELVMHVLSTANRFSQPPPTTLKETRPNIRHKP